MVKHQIIYPSVVSKYACAVPVGTGRAVVGPKAGAPEGIKAANTLNGMSAVCPVTTPVTVSVARSVLPFKGYDPCSAMIVPYRTRRARRKPVAVAVLTENPQKDTRNTVVVVDTLIRCMGAVTVTAALTGNVAVS